jgi:tetratricopeptide (TPR) repeat protein
MVSMNFFQSRRGARTNFLLALLMAVLFAGQALGQTPSWQLDGPAFSASVADIQNAAAKIIPEKFMDATVFFERDAYTIDEQGRVIYRHSMIYRIETQAGIENWAETSERWEPWYQKQPEIYARVILPDGRVSQLDQKTITDGPAQEEDEATYTDARIRKAPLPGLTAGAIVEEETVLQDQSPFFSGGGVYRDTFSRNVPIIRSEMTVDAAKQLKLQYRTHLLPDVSITDEEQAGVRHLKFVQGYEKARQDSDIDLPTHIFLGPMVEFSTGESWAAVAGAYRQLAEAQIDPAQVKSLLPGGSSASRLETIQQIVSRLHKEIRYTGIEFGEAALQPQTAAEILKRHYGDCKDKAAMLVALLRAEGIAAQMALLDTGPGEDVTPELPGMNEFDHAIVYLPGDGKGNAPLWIDATAEYAQVGVLPEMDQGRLELIIADGTVALTPTPTPKPEDDVLTELRDVVMAKYGPAHITETSLTRGDVDQDYRSDYGSAETREKKTNLETYAKNQYLAKALTGTERGDGKDFTKPFVLKLDMAEAKRANTGMDDAGIAIPFTSIFYRLPKWFTTDPNPNGDKLTPQQEEDQKRAVAARVSEYDVHPFVTEWRYKITPPAGFVLRALPENKSTDLGPAKLTQHYEADAQGVITAVLRFDTGKAKYSVDEALALRDAIVAAYKQDMIMVLFDQEGSKLMAAGKIREALAVDRGLIDRYPKDGLHHAQIAYVFLKAGMGDRARAEAQQATRLDPASAVSFQTLGWICQFNAIGIQYAHGFDWDCAEAAYKKALELDPEETNTALNLAILDEHAHDGERYGVDAHLADAIRQYKAVKETDKPTGDEYEDNLLFDLLYSGQYKELLQELDKLSSSVTRDGLRITATVALQGGKAGIAAGIDLADHLPAGAQQRNSALSSAGNQLMHLRLYSEAAEILSASVEGESNAAGVTQQIGLLRKLTPWKGDFFPANDPRSAVQRVFIGFMTGNFTEEMASQLLSRHAYGTDLEWKRNLEKGNQSQGMLQVYAAQSGLPANVLLDVIVGNLKLTAEGDDTKGYKVSVQGLGSKAQQFFVSKEDGVYKVVTDGQMSEAGNEALYLVHEGREAEARFLLDWMRDRIHRGGGDDPLEGALLPRFWTVGDTSGPEAIELAAASLVATTPSVAPSIKYLLPKVQAAREKAATDEKRLDLELLQASILSAVEDGPALKTVSSEILAKYPDSYVAINLAGQADGMLKDWNDWNSMLDTRLAKRPDDENLLRLKVTAAEAQGYFALVRATEQLVIDKGKASAGDYNLYAWTSLFDGKVDADVVKAAQQANMQANNSSYNELHTLACIYAFQGKTSEARELLLKAMTANNLSEPDSAIWFGFGSIYEQYGVNDAAIAAYRKVDKPEGPISPIDTYVLAQMRRGREAALLIRPVNSRS